MSRTGALPRALASGMALTMTALAAPTALRAQEDFRAVDADRPIRVEDAYPVKYLEWEWQLGSRTSFAEAGTLAAAALFELKFGIARNWQLGVEAHPSLERTGGISESGLEELGVSLLYNLNQEGMRTPALAIRTDVFSPGLGDLGREELGGRVRAILTRSYGRLRLHGNGAYSWASVADSGDFWSGGLAFDYPIGLFSRSVLGDLYAEIPTDAGRARVWAELGARLQLTNATVLDLGVTTRLDQWEEGTPNVGLVLGLSRVFGISGLVRVPPYPNPRID